MKIGQFEPKGTPATPTTSAKVDRKSGPGKDSSGVEPSARVELSSASALVAGDASFDAAKVDRIASAIRDGKYQIDAGVIADKLIANAQELIARGAR